ncbi:MAG TPA: hypothetical protein VF057_07670, partial [Thermoanaerobaculia bacterium]
RSPHLSLRIPAFAVAEAGMVLERRRGERRKFVHEDLSRHTREVSRAKILQRYDAAVQTLKAELLTGDADEDARWIDFRTRVLDRIDVIPLEGAMLAEMLELQLTQGIGQFPDALMFAAVKLHLTAQRREGIRSPAIFVSTDEKAFGSRVLVQQLREVGCTFINSFPNAVQRLRRG